MQPAGSKITMAPLLLATLTHTVRPPHILLPRHFAAQQMLFHLLILHIYSGRLHPAARRRPKRHGPAQCSPAAPVLGAQATVPHALSVRRTRTRAGAFTVFCAARGRPWVSRVGLARRSRHRRTLYIGCSPCGCSCCIRCGHRRTSGSKSRPLSRCRCNEGSLPCRRAPAYNERNDERGARSGLASRDAIWAGVKATVC